MNEQIKSVRDLASEEFDTRTLLRNAVDQAIERHYEDLFIVDVDSPGPTLLYIAESYYPGWRAYYLQKWGGDRGQERFTEPFSRDSELADGH